MTRRPDLPGPLMRRGPRPLLLHLTLAMLRSTVSRAMSPLWSADWPNSNGAASLQAAAILQAVQSSVRDASHAGDVPAAIIAETIRQDAALIAGIAAYRRHPYQRLLADPPTVWSEGNSRLLDYGLPNGRRSGQVSGEASGPESGEASGPESGEASGPGSGQSSAQGSAQCGGLPVLFVPSLVNRAYVLDLQERHSMLRWLAAQGVRPLLLDWGWPGDAERRFTLTDYVAGRLERAMLAAARHTSARPVLAGYCMGGTLAVAAAQRRPELISGLALLAAPWDFHAPDPKRAAQAAETLPLLEPALTFNHALPVDALQSLFVLLDPWGVAEKYRGFARLPPDSARARLFVALEDWLNDGIPLAAEVARACLRDWYGANAPARGTWLIAGLPVDPRQITAPSFVAAPGRDRIVPAESATPLASLLPNATLHQPAAGHVSMTAGARAESALWRPLLAWLRSISARDAAPSQRRRA